MRLLAAWSRLQRRATKNAMQALRPRPQHRAIAYVFGAQRSGTNMVTEVLEKSPETRVHNETSQVAFRHYRIRPPDTIMALVERIHAKWLVLKPISDSHRAQDLINVSPGSKALWVFRDYRDASNSAVRHWGQLERARIIHLSKEKPFDSAHPKLALSKEQFKLFARSDWLLEGLSRSDHRLLQRLEPASLSVESAAALKWYFRTNLYFSLDDEHRGNNVQLVKYEDLVSRSKESFGAIFDFLSIDFEDRFTGHVHAKSVKKRPFPPIHKVIEEKCEELLDRLNEEYGRQASK